MRQLGKKKGIQDGVLVAYGSSCNCASVCGVASCNGCTNDAAHVSLQVTDTSRARNYGGYDVMRGIM